MPANNHLIAEIVSFTCFVSDKNSKTASPTSVNILPNAAPSPLKP